MKRTVSCVVLTFLLLGTLAFAFNVGLVHAQAQTVYINSDGSVSPSDTPILSVDNVTYTLTGNISYPAYYGIVVERNNTVINGNGYTVQGYARYGGNGISLKDISNVTIENAIVEGFQYGIYLFDSDNNMISGNNATANSAYGILIWSSSYNTVSGNIATANSWGIYLYSSSNNNTVSGNIATANSIDGIILDSSSDDVLSGNNVTANIDGIYLYFSSGDVLSGNSVTANSAYGIYLESSSNNAVDGNNVTANRWGISLYTSSGNVLSGNLMASNTYGNFGVHGEVLSDFVNRVDASNLVDGMPVYYLMNQSNTVISSATYPNGVGYLGLVNCENVTVQGLALTQNSQGLLLAFTNDSKISGNDVTANGGYGIYLWNSSGNVLSGNNVTANRLDGIDLYSSSNNNTLSGNNVAANGGAGIYLWNSSDDNSLSGNNVTANSYHGIVLGYSSGNVLSGDNVMLNGYGNFGLYLYYSNSSIISANTIANNYCGIDIYVSSGNSIYHNNFINNTYQVNTYNSTNTWDNGYPSGGNFWSDYNGTDFFSGPSQNVTGSDGIGDTPCVIDANNTDDYPLMGMFSDFYVLPAVDVQVVSNSTVSDFQFNGTAILFNVSGTNGTTGFCNVCVPTALLNGTLSVFVNGTQVQYSLLPNSNSSNSYLYFTYGHSTEQVMILPEFPDSLILAIFMLATLLPIGIHKKRRSRSEPQAC